LALVFLSSVNIVARFAEYSFTGTSLPALFKSCCGTNRVKVQRCEAEY
jgi:hypothetical protein